MRTCPDCSSSVSDQAVYCDNCGFELNIEANTDEVLLENSPFLPSRSCSSCGYKNIPGETFCQNCGVQLPPVLSEPPPPPTPILETTQDDPGPPSGHEPKQSRETFISNCTECGTEITSGTTFCPNCGIKLAIQDDVQDELVQISAQREISGQLMDIGSEDIPEEVLPGGPCPSCGHINDAEETFCQICGLLLAVIEKADSVTGPPPEASFVQDDALGQPATHSKPPTCPTCGVDISKLNEPFCQNCGQGLLSSDDGPIASYDTFPLKSQPKENLDTTPIMAMSEIRGKLVLSILNEEIELPRGRGEIIIGRNDPNLGILPDVDLTLYGGDKSGVSRQHARLFIQNSSLFIEDLGSTNFTYLNEQKLPPNDPHVLQDGDEVRLGGMIFRYQLSKK